VLTGPNDKGIGEGTDPPGKPMFVVNVEFDELGTMQFDTANESLDGLVLTCTVALQDGENPEVLTPMVRGTLL
jgi:hypothetical protein